MATKKQLDRATYDAIVGKAKAGLGRSAIRSETGLSEQIVGKVLAAAGFSKSKPEVVERDRAVVAKWMERAGAKLPGMPVRRKPAARKARKTTK
jgi:hypothetical protein